MCKDFGKPLTIIKLNRFIKHDPHYLFMDLKTFLFINWIDHYKRAQYHLLQWLQQKDIITDIKIKHLLFSSEIRLIKVS